MLPKKLPVFAHRGQRSRIFWPVLFAGMRFEMVATAARGKRPRSPAADAARRYEYACRNSGRAAYSRGIAEREIFRVSQENDGSG